MIEVVDLKVHEDHRGSFKEVWRRANLDLDPVQLNVSLNHRGTTRGMHAEPWDKLVTVAAGRVFGAWIDLREGSPTFGQTQTLEFGPETAVLVPRGVANGFQALEDDTAYTYLVSDYWSAKADYVNLNVDLIDWPEDPVHVSAKDREAPRELTAMPAKKILVTGADGQLGQGLRALLPDAEFCSREEFDITNPPQRPWRQYRAIINAAAYTNVDKAETERGQAWAVNATGPAHLARIAASHDLTLVHISTDYVFGASEPSSADGYTEAEQPAPLNFYGASKAAGDAAVATTRKHYILRTSWVTGQGDNFIATMAELARHNKEPRVVDDQRGRPTFADDLAKAIIHLLDTQPEYGIYNVTGGGDAVGRDEVAMATFIGLGHDPAEVHPTSTAEYYGDREYVRRPSTSTLDLSKIMATGFTPQHWRVGLALYL